MKQWRLHFPVKIMSRVLGVSRSGFYTWLGRKPSRRTQEDERLKVAGVLVDTDVAIDYLRGESYARPLLELLWEKGEAVFREG